MREKSEQPSQEILSSTVSAFDRAMDFHRDEMKLQRHQIDVIRWTARTSVIYTVGMLGILAVGAWVFYAETRAHDREMAELERDRDRVIASLEWDRDYHLQQC